MHAGGGEQREATFFDGVDFGTAAAQVGEATARIGVGALHDLP